eukprot:3997158-Pleurochrysis_carterae.AAC.5
MWPVPAYSHPLTDERLAKVWQQVDNLVPTQLTVDVFLALAVYHGREDAWDVLRLVCVHPQSHTSRNGSNVPEPPLRAREEKLKHFF